MLFLHDGLEDTALVVLRFDFLGFQIDDLSELVHTIATCENFPQNFTCKLLERVLQIFKRKVRWLQILLVLIRLVVKHLG